MNKTSTLQRKTTALRTRLLPLRLAALAAFGPMLAGGALAQDSYMYFGLGPGQTRGVFNDQRITGHVIAPTPNTDGGSFTNYSIATDRRDAGYKLFFGYQMNRYVGFELGYFNLGKYGFANTTTPNGTLAAELRAQGANLDVVGTLPITEKFAVIGRVGSVYARTRAEFAGTGAVTVTDPHPSRREANMKLGVGLQYAFNDSFQMRAEGEDYRVNDSVGEKGHIRMYSVSFVFPFGRTGSSMKRVAYVEPAAMPYTPAPVAVMAPAPEPRVAPMPLPPAPVAVAPAASTRRVSYSAENLFGFDSSVVRPEGKVALDSFAAELDGTTYVNIGVEGFTDRIGSEAYNQALSVRRAEAVKEYLVTNGRVDPAKITTTGLGEGTPQTKSTDCKGDKKSASLIACLQPDRRVEIEVSGTR